MSANDFLAIMCPSCDTVEIVPLEGLHVCTFCGTTIFSEENREPAQERINKLMGQSQYYQSKVIKVLRKDLEFLSR